MSAALLASLLSIVAVVSGGSIGIAVHVLGRRAASGRVRTSEASVLWEQAQDMRRMLLEEKTRAEEQRDKLIDAYTQQILPVLGSINKLTGDLLAQVTDNARLVREIHARTVQGAGPDAQAH